MISSKETKVKPFTKKDKTIHTRSLSLLGIFHSDSTIRPLGVT